MGDGGEGIPLPRALVGGGGGEEEVADVHDVYLRTLWGHIDRWADRLIDR